MPKARSGAKDTKGKARRREGVSLKASWAEGDYHAHQGSDESDSDDPGNTQEIPFRLVMPRLFSTYDMQWQPATALSDHPCIPVPEQCSAWLLPALTVCQATSSAR